MNALIRLHLALAGLHLATAWWLYEMSERMSHLERIRKDDPHVQAKVQRYELVKKALA